MTQQLKKNSTIRNYIFFSNVHPRLKNPLIISLSIHGLLILSSLLLTPKDRLSNQLTIEIINTPEKMSVKTYARASSVEDLSKKIRETSIKKNLLQADPDSLMNDHSKELNSGFDKPDESFVKKYENILFNRKNIDSHEKSSVNDNKNHFKWEDDKSNISHSGKNKNAEIEKIPTGRGESKSIRWRAGYARKLTFQPEIEYPVYFRKQGIQASVQLIIDVDASGNVVNAEILQSSGYSKLDILARTGVLKAKFLKRDNVNNTYDRGEVEVQYRLDR